MLPRLLIQRCSSSASGSGTGDGGSPRRRSGRLRERADRSRITPSVRRFAAEQITYATAFLQWLSTRNSTLASCDQLDIDAWFAENTEHGRTCLRAFLNWAMQSRRCPRALSIPVQRVSRRPALSEDERLDTLGRLLTDADTETALRSALALRYNTVKPFLSLLAESKALDAAPAGRRILTGVQRLPALSRRKVGEKPLLPREVDDKLVPSHWRKAVYANADLPQGAVDRDAYVVCVLEQLFGALKHRDIFASPSHRWLLESLPGIGKVRAGQLLADLDISERRRVQGLGARQKERLLELFPPRT